MFNSDAGFRLAADTTRVSCRKEYADMAKEMSGDHRKILESFVVDNPELAQLEDLLSEFNMFEAIGATRQELRHSDFLRFLLDPRERHGLRDYFLKTLFKKVL